MTHSTHSIGQPLFQEKGSGTIVISTVIVRISCMSKAFIHVLATAELNVISPPKVEGYTCEDIAYSDY